MMDTLCDSIPLSGYVLAAAGSVKYKFIEESHFWPNRTRFWVISRQGEVYKAFYAAHKPGMEFDKDTLSAIIAKPESNENEEKSANEIGEITRQKVIDAAIEPKISKNEKEEKSATGEEEITGPALINRLSDDCLIAIFSYLPIKERLEIEDVCVRWQNVSKRAWHGVRELEVCNSFDMEFFGRYFHSIFIKKILLRCGVYLKTLKLHLVCSSYMLKVIGEYCHNLTSIKLAFTKYDVKHFNALSKMKKLQSFALTDIEPEFLTDCLLNLPKTVESIRICLSTSGYFICKRLPTCITNIIEELNALNSVMIEGFIFGENLIEFISKKEAITKLSLASSQIERNLNLLTDLSNLEHLDLQKVDAVDNNFLTCISTKCQKLKYLDVSHCSQLSDKGIEELKNLNNLEVLLMDKMANSVTDLPLGKLRGIRKLVCSSCSQVKDPGIMQLITNCPDLKHLDVLHTSISEETLRFAISATKDRENSLILYLLSDIRGVRRMNLKEKSEDYSPFLVIHNPPFWGIIDSDNEDDSSWTDDDYDNIEYEDIFYDSENSDAS